MNRPKPLSVLVIRKPTPHLHHSTTLDDKHLWSIIMKCISIKLVDKQNQGNNSNNSTIRTSRIENVVSTTVINSTHLNHRYCFPYIITTKAEIRRMSLPQIAIKTLHLADDVQTFNMGHSMEKWSRKTARLKSAHQITASSCFKTITPPSALILSQIERHLKPLILYQQHQDAVVSMGNFCIAKQRTSSKKRQRRKTAQKGQKVPSPEEGGQFPDPIILTLSSPPSPKTQQIIRVEVRRQIRAVDFFRDGFRSIYNKK